MSYHSLNQVHVVYIQQTSWGQAKICKATLNVWLNSNQGKLSIQAKQAGHKLGDGDYVSAGGINIKNLDCYCIVFTQILAPGCMRPWVRLPLTEVLFRYSPLYHFQLLFSLVEVQVWTKAPTKNFSGSFS